MPSRKEIEPFIEDAINARLDSLAPRMQNSDTDRIHALEVVNCMRFSYYERKNPVPNDRSSKIADLLNNSFRQLLGNQRREFKVDQLILELDADMIFNDEFVIRLEVTRSLPELSNPRHLLYLNSCLFVFDKKVGILIYITPDGKCAEFSVAKNNRMFEEVIRRAKVLNTLLKDGKVPIIEPSELCNDCKYFDRCYVREKAESGNSSLLEIFKQRQ